MTLPPKLRVADLRDRPIESRVTIRDTRFPGAAAAGEQRQWLQWLELGGASQGTITQYGWSTDRLLKRWPDVPYAGFTDVHLLEVLSKVPPRSRLTAKRTFSSWFKWGIRTRRLVVNPCDFLPDFKKQRQPIVEVFTVEEEAALRALPEPHGTLMALMFDTGIRKGEARGLTGKRVDFQREQLIIIDGAKGGKQRIVPIDQETAPFLIGRLDHLMTTEAIGDDSHFWSGRPGGGNRITRDHPIPNASFHDWWVRCIADAGVKYRSPHKARHTYATRWRGRGVDLADIAFVLGHESVETTQRIYVHEDVVKVAQRMAAARAREAQEV